MGQDSNLVAYNGGGSASTEITMNPSGFSAKKVLRGCSIDNTVHHAWIRYVGGRDLDFMGASWWASIRFGTNHELLLFLSGRSNRNRSGTPKKVSSIKDPLPCLIRAMAEASFSQRWLVGPKLIYTCMSMVYYGFYQYRTNFSDERLGFTTIQYGYMSGWMALVGFCCMALWGSLADLTKNPKMVLSAVSLGTAASFSLFLIPVSGPLAFWVNMGILALYAGFAAGFQALCDDQVLRILSVSDKDLYGRQRVWETISFSVTTHFLAVMMRKFGMSAIHVWVPIAAVLFVIVIQIFGTNRIDEDHKEVVEDEEEMLKKEDVESSTNLLPAPTQRPVWVLMGNPHFLFLLFGVFLTGCARSVMSTFLSRYLQNDMGLDEVQTSMAASCGIILELAIFFGSSFCLKTLGIYWMLILAQVAMVARGWAYVAVAPVPSNWWAIYLVELLKGVGFGFTQTAGVRLANELVPAGLEATSQSLYTGMYSQLPAVLMGFLGGHIYQDYGAHSLFLGTAILSSSALILFLLKYSLDGRLHWRRTVS